jgi:hypothetical protein
MDPTTAARARSADQTNGRERGAGASGGRDTVLFFMGMVAKKVRRERQKKRQEEDEGWAKRDGGRETQEAAPA